MPGGWARVGEPGSGPLSGTVGRAGGWVEGPPRERVCFLFLRTLDKSLRNDIPQMSLMMCVANFFFFLVFSEDIFSLSASRISWRRARGVASTLVNVAMCTCLCCFVFTPLIPIDYPH